MNKERKKKNKLKENNLLVIVWKKHKWQSLLTKEWHQQTTIPRHTTSPDYLYIITLKGRSLIKKIEIKNLHGRLNLKRTNSVLFNSSCPVWIIQISIKGSWN